MMPSTPERIALCAAIVNACRDNGWTEWLTATLAERSFEQRTTDDLRSLAQRCGREAVTPSQLPSRSARSTCMCGDTGWIDGPPIERPHHTYTSLKPCRCTFGQQAHDRLSSGAWNPDRDHERTTR